MLSDHQGLSTSVGAALTVGVLSGVGHREKTLGGVTCGKSRAHMPNVVSTGTSTSVSLQQPVDLATYES